MPLSALHHTAKECADRLPVFTDKQRPGDNGGHHGHNRPANRPDGRHNSTANRREDCPIAPAAAMMALMPVITGGLQANGTDDASQRQCATDNDADG